MATPTTTDKEAVLARITDCAEAIHVVIRRRNAEDGDNIGVTVAALIGLLSQGIRALISYDAGTPEYIALDGLLSIVAGDILFNMAQVEASVPKPTETIN